MERPTPRMELVIRPHFTKVAVESLMKRTKEKAITDNVEIVISDPPEAYHELLRDAGVVYLHWVHKEKFINGRTMAMIHLPANLQQSMRELGFVQLWHWSPDSQ